MVVCVASLDSPIGVNVSFRYQAFDGTATTADCDYTAMPLTTATIAAGNSTIAINVVTTADTKYEVNETLTVTLTNAANGTFVENVGLGTITNDDPIPKIFIADASARQGHKAVFNGVKVMIWGGVNGSGTTLNTGALYDPVGNSWTNITTTNAPTARKAFDMALVRGKVYVWGGNDGSSPVNDGAAFDLTGVGWTNMTSSGAPSTREGHTMVATDQGLIVWGGVSAGVYRSDGAFYNVNNTTWTALSGSGNPAARSGHTAIWTGYVGDGQGRGSLYYRLNTTGDRGRMYIWGGADGSGKLNSGGVLNPPNP